jgi:carboxylesterase type B
MSENRFETVDTEHGPIKGQRKSSVLGRNFFSFQGIPYMKPPFGKLRFRDPLTSEAWTETFDATKEPPSFCHSSYHATLSSGKKVRNHLKLSDESLSSYSKFEGQEDAGVINVYTPYVQPKKLLPVMVWIHGGGFMVR